jgi:hypothetical protein
MDETPMASAATLGHDADTARDDIRKLYAFTPELLEQGLNQLVATQMPRFFALCAVTEDRYDGWVAGWGMALEDEAIVMAVDEPALGVFQSPESAIMVMSGGRPELMRLIWCDTVEPYEPTG